MPWNVKEEKFNRENIVNNGNKFITGNGYMGFRGTLEEYTKNELVACNISGLYDRQGDNWREPINAPNGILTTLIVDGEEYSVLKEEPTHHTQELDIKEGIHRRNTVWNREKGKVIIKTERFISLSNVHLICLKYTVSVDESCEIVINTGIDGDVWDINGPHLEHYKLENDEAYIKVSTLTQELKVPVVVAEICKRDFEAEETILKTEKSILPGLQWYHFL